MDMIDKFSIMYPYTNPERDEDIFFDYVDNVALCSGVKLAYEELNLYGHGKREVSKFLKNPLEKAGKEIAGRLVTRVLSAPIGVALTVYGVGKELCSIDISIRTEYGYLEGIAIKNGFFSNISSELLDDSNPKVYGYFSAYQALLVNYLKENEVIKIDSPFFPYDFKSDELFVPDGRDLFLYREKIGKLLSKY